jgi:hypothetical protein
MTYKYRYRKHPALYEINTAAWLFELSQKMGEQVTLRNVPPAEWDTLRASGMDFLWLMGVWKHSEASRRISLNDPDLQKQYQTVLPGFTPEDVIGSCYSTCSPEPDPLVGEWEDIDHARIELHKRSMGLILDFIPNHIGIDHQWLTGHPEYFVQADEEDYHAYPEAFFPLEHEGRRLYIAHGRDPNFPPWSDTAQLNYFNPATREAMMQRLEQLAPHCDGLRCDMAMLILNDVFQKTWGWSNRNPAYKRPVEEFWAEAIRRVPGLVYIAEAYWDTEWTLQQLGFDFVYDKRLYDRLRYTNPREIYLHLTAGMDFQEKLVRFIENHDESRSAAALGPGKVEATAALYAGLPGMKLHFHGQWEGKQLRLPLQLRQTRPEATNQVIKAFYDQLLPVVNSPVFHEGAWKLKEAYPDMDNTAGNLICYIWKLADRLALVIVNLSSDPAECRICFEDDVEESINYSLVETFTGLKMVRHGKLMAHPGLRFTLKGYQAQIFDIAPVE